jgi:hypothetical protein
MQTKRLQEVVNMVSSILTDFPVHPKTLHTKNTIVITTQIWDFYLTRLENSGCYTLDEVVVSNGKLADKHSYIKQQIMREVFGRYCVTNTL